MSAPPTRSQTAFYATGPGTGRWRDWLTLLHPPYTAWHLSYVAIGAALAPHPVAWRLGVSVLAFFLAVGVGAHALDELRGRPLRTGIPGRQLGAAAVCGVGAAIGLGLALGRLRLLPFVLVGAVLVAGYNLELFGGRLHNSATFAAAWGAFPVLTGYYAQHFTLGWPAVAAAVAGFALSWAQRSLSTPARMLRRRTASASALLVTTDGSRISMGIPELLRPLESALRATAWAMVALAVALVLARLG